MGYTIGYLSMGESLLEVLFVVGHDGLPVHVPQVEVQERHGDGELLNCPKQPRLYVFL